MNLYHAPNLSSSNWTVSEIDAAVARALPNADRADPLRGALEAALAHYCQRLGEALNRVPERHLAAFVAQIPLQAVPPVPATAPLAFRASQASASVDVPVVPRYTEVAGAPTDGGAPVVYQTTRDLPVLRVELKRALRVDMQSMLSTDLSAVVASVAAKAAKSAPPSATPLVPAMHLGLLALGAPPALTGMQLQVGLDSALLPPRVPMLEWGIATQETFVAWEPLSDTTCGLTQSGQISFGAPPVPMWPRTTLHGSENCWLSVRFRFTAAPVLAPKPAPPESSRDTAALPQTRAAQPGARIRALSISTQHTLAAASVESAWYERIPLDVTRDFFPFGERPRFGDVFYVASRYFALPGARINLQITLTNPADGNPDDVPIALVSTEGSPRVQWDIQTQSAWTPLLVDDGTRSLTVNGALTFTVPADAAMTAMGANTSGWLRARLMSGSYGVARPALENVMMPTVVAPSIAGVTVSVALVSEPRPPERIVLDDGLEQIQVGTTDRGMPLPFYPAVTTIAAAETLYVGIQAAPAALATQTLNLYLAFAQGDAPPLCRDASSPSGAAPRWQVRGASGWCDCAAVDQTAGLRESGFIELCIGPDVATWRDAIAAQDRQLLWLRCLLDAQDDGPRLPGLQRIAVNVVPAVQAIRLEREVLGSSTGRAGMVFHTAQAPLVGDIELEVREGAATSAQPWQRWQCVGSLDDATPQSAVFVADRLSGALTFGDGRRGRIPPAGGNNLRITYAAGGGARGNCAPLKIAQLRTTIPHVESVTNVDAACGGQDAQGERASREAALAWLRHRDRAVCIDDYAALALRAAPEVALATALGAAELRGGQPLPSGAVGVAVVPRSTAREPQPSAALLRAVKRFLDARRPSGVDLMLFGPSYLRVSVSAALAIDPDTQPSRVIAQCVERLDRFLHPLMGGRFGSGWSFGERPHPSDFHEVLAGVDGLNYAQSIRLRFDAAFPDSPGAARCLICAGTHALHAS